MLKKFFNKKKEQSSDHKNIPIIALLVHAAKIDEKYTDIEKSLIKKALMDLSGISQNESEKLLKEAEIKEQESNQIVELITNVFTHQIESR